MSHALNDINQRKLRKPHQLGKNSFLIYGTAWKKEKTASLVKSAIVSGFRHIDTACQPKHYNEKGVGVGWVEAAKDLGLKREDLFLQTKFTSVSGQDKSNIPYDINASLEDQVNQSVEKSLENLQTSYIDRLVLHSPMDTYEDTMLVWRVFESFVSAGKVRSLGISNCYDYRLFERIYNAAKVKPKSLQNRFYEKSNFDVELRQFCLINKLEYQSFWTLTANRNALKKQEVLDLAGRKHLTPQTLMYAYMMSMGHTPLSGTTDSRHMKEDVALMKRMKSGEEVFTSDELYAMSRHLGIAS